jgi:hypothetical protein
MKRNGKHRPFAVVVGEGDILELGVDDGGGLELRRRLLDEGNHGVYVCCVR